MNVIAMDNTDTERIGKAFFNICFEYIERNFLVSRLYDTIVNTPCQ
jgi:hypothetical protein